MWRIAARLQYNKFSYSFKVTGHQIFIELFLIKASSLAFRLTLPTVNTNTSYDYEVIQHILSRGYSTPIFFVELLHIKPKS